ncbi:uncharacterized protein ARMOST_15590 [Armillaria ostoyae]|uniref:Uncharacterized protein n=1 Tax=Armillaria ostoyae TaxID=47428 RepID=A0A284RTR1_ARMOS|nr:uncharacterized protein ARMOST_15590 [Armillaria ostoyae]
MNTDGSPLKSKIIPARNAAKKASSSFSRQLDMSPVNSDDEYERPSRQRRRRGKGRERGGGSRRGRGKSTASTPSALSRTQSQGGFAPESSGTHRHPSSLSSTSKKKRSFSFSTLSDGDESPLTSVPTTPVKQSTSFHNAKRSEATALTRSWSSVSKLSTSFERPWSLEGLGNYVWVLVSSAGSVFQEEDEKEYVWWPAKKHRLVGHQLTLIPFGDLNPRLTRITVEHPCSENVLSLTDSLGRNRFNEPVFLPPSAIGDLEGSPRKKQKTDRGDIGSRWQAALHKMLQEKEEEEDQDDNLPEIAFALSVRSTHASAPGSPSRRKKQTWTSISDTDEAEDLELWDVPSADPELDIPGELVLAREKADLNLSYWPGKVLEYVPPVSRNQKAGKYKVLYLDGTTRTIPRTWFHCLGDEEFGTCKLGEFESTAANNPDDNDENSTMGQPHDREPSPVPSIPPPSSTDFIYLSIREQFCYTKPILRAVLNEAYPPAMQAHDMFMAGGKGRKILNQNAGERGTVTPNDVERLTHLLLFWALRNEMVAKRITSDGIEETAPDDPETPQNTAEVVGEGTRDAGTIVDGIANGASHNVDGKETSVVDNEVETRPPISQAEEGPLKPSSALSVIVQDGEAPSMSSQMASQAPAVRAKSPGSVAESFVPSPSEEPPPSSLAPSVGDVDMEEPEEDLEGRQTPHLDSSQYTDIEVPPTDLIDQKTSQPILHTTENGDTVEEGSGESTPANVVNETYEGPPRQVGCERYESLSQLEKFEYCQNVLLPEAILQILLWKEGARTSVELLSDDEEQRLHKQGEALRRKTDWVFDVMHLRSQAARALKRKAGKSKLEKVGGTRTRPMYKMV